MTPSEPESKTERHFIELATRTLEDQPELRDEARGELMGRLAHSGAKEEVVEAALCQLAKAVPQRWSRKGMLSGSVMLLMLGILIAFQLLAMRPELELWPVALQKRDAYNELLRKLPDSAQQLFLKGPTAKTYLGTGTNRKILPHLQHLQSLHPNDPAIYEEYVLQYHQDMRKLPPDFREIWQRIDPGNGMWLILEAMAGGETAESLEKAATAERFDIRVPELRQRRFSFLTVPAGAAGTVVGNVALLRMAEELDSGPTLSPGSYPVWLYHALESPRLDPESFRSHLKTWKRLSSHLFAECQSLNDFEPARWFLDAGRFFKGAATRLGLNDDRADVDRLLDDVEKVINQGIPIKVTLGKPYEPWEAEQKTMGVVRSRFVDRPFEPDRYQPIRFAEYAATERYSALAAAILLLLPLAAVWLESCRRGKRVNGLADGLAPVFTAGDAGWLLGLGCGLPLLWYGGITRLTPLGCRDIGVSYFARPIPPAAIQLTATLLLSGVLMFQTGTTLLRKRLGFLGLGGRFPAAGWVVAAVTALLVPLAGAVRWLSRDEQEFLQGVAAACGIPLLWLVWQAGMIVFSSSSSALRGVLLSRRLITPLAVTCLVLLGLQPLLRSAERQWLAKDMVSRSDPAHGGIPVGEALAVERVSKALSELLAE